MLICHCFSKTENDPTVDTHISVVGVAKQQGNDKFGTNGISPKNSGPDSNADSQKVNATRQQVNIDYI